MDKYNSKIMLVLRDYPKARDDDRILYWTLCYLFFLTEIKEKRFGDLPQFESITRVRRHIQYKLHLYPASPEIDAKRRTHQKKYY